MTNREIQGAEKPQKPDVPARAFPSLELWEAEREADIDLATLRANRQALDAMERVFATDGHDGRVLATLAVDLVGIREAVRLLAVGEGASARLLSDTLMIASWHLVPARRARMAVDRAADFRSLAAILKAASAFKGLTIVDFRAAEMLIHAATGADGMALEGVDLIELGAQLEILNRVAGRATKLLATKPGRKSATRRDRTLMMLAEAVEEATRERIGKSKGTTQNPDWHFTNAAGRYVLTIMRLLGFQDERVLVGALLRLQASQAKQQMLV